METYRKPTKKDFVIKNQRMKVISDAGAIYALMDKDDRWHLEVKRVLEEEKLELILPSTTLPEIS